MKSNLLRFILVMHASILLSCTALAFDDLAGFENASVSSQFLYSSPAIADLDGDISNGKEITALGQDGWLYAWRSDGSLLWKFRTPSALCTTSSALNKGYSSPAVGNIFGDSRIAVVVGYGGLGTKSCTGGVVAVNGATGSRLWTFDLRSFAQLQRFSERMHGVFGTPVLADVNGDGKMEIAFGGFDRRVYLLNYNGRVRAYYHAADTVWSSPSFVNVDSTPDLELIAATDISQNSRLNPPTFDGGNVYAFKTTQRPSTKLNCGFRQKDCFVWLRPLDQVLFSSPSIGDVLPNNPGPEIVIQSGCYFPEGTTRKRGKWIKILNAKDGKVLQTIPITACSSSSPALADVNNDGYLDIFATVNGAQAVGGDGRGRIIGWTGATRSFLWQVAPIDAGRLNDARMGEHSSPVVADLDGNGSLEVMAVNVASIAIIDAATGTELSCNTSACDSMIRVRFGTGRSTPAIDDVNNDGILDMAIAARKVTTAGQLRVFTNFAEDLGSFNGSGTPYAVPWGMFKKTANRNAAS